MTKFNFFDKNEAQTMRRLLEENGFFFTGKYFAKYLPLWENDLFISHFIHVTEITETEAMDTIVFYTETDRREVYGRSIYTRTDGARPLKEFLSLYGE